MFKRSGTPITYLTLIALLLISACAAAPKSYAPIAAPQTSRAAADESAAPASGPSLSKGSESNSAVPSSTGSTSTERVVIKNADLSIVVKDPIESMNAIGKMSEEMGGFIVSSNAFKTRLESGAELPEAKITVRVPAEKLNKALETIKAQVQDPSKDVLSEVVNGQDVTDKYTDLKSRLTNLEQTEKQLQKIMDSTTKTEDVLSVYNRLIQIREQIEVLKGQIRYYEQSAALSAVNVRLQAQEAIQPLTIGGWQPVGVVLNAVQVLINVLKFLFSATVYFLIVAVPVIFFFYLVFRVLKWFFRLFRKPKGPTPPPPARPMASPPPSAPQPPQTN